MKDIRPLVTRVARALGPGATPEKVEAVVAAVLEDDALPRPALSSPDSGERAIVTAYGVDHPGVLRDVTAGVSEAGCNILDVSQKILQGYFTLIMISALAGLRGTIANLQTQLIAIAEPLRVLDMAQQETLFSAM